MNRELVCKTTGMTRAQLAGAVERARDAWMLSGAGSREAVAALAELREKSVLLRRLDARLRR